MNEYLFGFGMMLAFLALCLTCIYIARLLEERKRRARRAAWEAEHKELMEGPNALLERLQTLGITDNVFTGALGGEKSPEATVAMSREIGLDARLVDADWPDGIPG